MNDHILARPRALRTDFISEPLRRIRKNKNKKCVLGSPPSCLSALLYFLESLGSSCLVSVLWPHSPAACARQRALCSKVPAGWQLGDLQEQVWPVKKTVSWRCQAPSGRMLCLSLATEPPPTSVSLVTLPASLVTSAPDLHLLHTSDTTPLHLQLSCWTRTPPLEGDPRDSAACSPDWLSAPALGLILPNPQYVSQNRQFHHVNSVLDNLISYPHGSQS